MTDAEVKGNGGSKVSPPEFWVDDFVERDGVTTGRGWDRDWSVTQYIYLYRFNPSDEWMLCVGREADPDDETQILATIAEAVE